MKLGIFSDPHIPAITDARFPEYEKTIKRMIADMKARGVEHVLCGGDISGSRTGRPQSQVIYAFGEWLDDLPTSIILGNHDMPRVSGEPHALSALVWRENIGVIASPTLVKTDKYQLVCLPYPNRNKFLAEEENRGLTWEEANQKIHSILVAYLSQAVQSLSVDIPSILLGHISLSTAKAGTESQYMFGRDLCLSMADIPDNLIYLFFGHVHKPQQMNRGSDSPFVVSDELFVIGSTECTDFGEQGEEKRWLLLDTQVGSVESVPTNCRQYKTFHVDIRPGADSDEIGPLDILGAVVRVQVKMRRGQSYDFEKLRHSIMDEGARSVCIEPEYDREDRLVEAESWVGETEEDIIRAYCRQRATPEPQAARLIESGTRLLNELAETERLSIPVPGPP